MPTKLDSNQVIKSVFDEANNRLRTDATINGDIVIGDIEISQVDDSIRIGDGTNLITATQDAGKTGLDVNIINDVQLDIDAASGDNIAISDGVDTLAVNADGSINVNANISATNLDIRDLTFATDKVDVSGSSVVVSATDLDIRDLSSVTDSVSVPGVATEAKQDTQITTLNAIAAGIPVSLGQTTMTNSMPVTIASNQTPIPVSATLADEPLKISGTIDGTPSGTEYGFVNNIRQQILASHDRTQDITYADFGTKNQRITQIDYASVTFTGVTARKVINYTLVGNNYRRDSINWVII